jgi:DNA-binding SARP family transcriptional activator
VDPAPVTHVVLLDGFALECGRDGGAMSVDDLPRGAQRLIAWLGLCGRPARGAIAGHLWPEVPEDRAQASLRSALWRVQRAVPGLVDASGGALRLARGVHVDVRDLTRWAQRVLDRQALGDGPFAPEVALHGELLPGWYDDWVLLERERLRQLRMHALEVRAETLAGAGRYGEAIEAAYAAVRTEPLRESAHRTVVRVHLAEGNVGEAVRAYASFRDLLTVELGVPPTAQMDALVRGHVRVRRTASGPAHSRTRPPTACH